MRKGGGRKEIRYIEREEMERNERRGARDLEKYWEGEAGRLFCPGRLFGPGQKGGLLSRLVSPTGTKGPRSFFPGWSHQSG